MEVRRQIISRKCKRGVVSEKSRPYPFEYRGLFFGSSQIRVQFTRKGILDLEDEVVVVAKPIGLAFDHLILLCMPSRRPVWRG